MLRTTKPILFQVKLAGLLLVPALLYCVPVSWLNERHTWCVFTNLFGFGCPGCGISRAILCALHLKFLQAWQFNKAYIIILPLLIYLWLKMVDSAYRQMQAGQRP